MSIIYGVKYHSDTCLFSIARAVLKKKITPCGLQTRIPKPLFITMQTKSNSLQYLHLYLHNSLFVTGKMRSSGIFSYYEDHPLIFSNHITWLNKQLATLFLFIVQYCRYHRKLKQYPPIIILFTCITCNMILHRYFIFFISVFKRKYTL